MSEPIFTGGFWGILELMGHTKLAGYITEEEKFGSKLGRIDIPGPSDTLATQYFGGSSIYRLTPTTEEIARATATINQPRPVSLWEVPALQRAASLALERERQSPSDLDESQELSDDEQDHGEWSEHDD